MEFDVYARQHVKVGHTQSITVWRKQRVAAEDEPKLLEFLQAKGLGEYWAYPVDGALGVRTYEKVTTEVEVLK